MEKEKFQGTVKFFNSEKGFGFIKSNTNKEDVFVHATGVLDDIKENDPVEYEMQPGKRGMNAVNVTIVR